MLSRSPVQKSLLSCLTLVTTVATGSAGCCGSDEWKELPFEEAGLTFSVPSHWDVQSLPLDGSSEPKPHKPAQGEAKAHSTTFKGAAVLTALPVLEDAALVIIAPQAEVAPEMFAHQMHLMPLEDVKFNIKNAHIGVGRSGALEGLAFDGSGRLSYDQGGTRVYFRSVIIDVSGKPSILTLYAEDEHKERYGKVFDRILERVSPIVSSEKVPPKALNKPSNKAPTRREAVESRSLARGALSGAQESTADKAVSEVTRAAMEAARSGVSEGDHGSKAPATSAPAKDVDAAAPAKGVDAAAPAKATDPVEEAAPAKSAEDADPADRAEDAAPAKAK